MSPRSACLALVLTACGAATPTAAELEAEARDCPGVTAAPALPPDAMVAVNAYYLQEEATRALRRGEASSAVVEEVFTKLAALGVRVVRTNGFNDDPEKAGDSAIQPGLLEYDEVALQGLDLVLARATAHGLRLVLPLGNYWNAYGGARQYVRWAGHADAVEGDPRFFTERAVVDHYRAHLTRLLSRRSTVDGRMYGAHPAVLAWELLNEPRGAGLDREGQAMRAWVDEIAGLVKALSPDHLVATGEEGFETTRAGFDAAFWRDAGPASLLEGGSSFRLNVASPSVDLASAHFYPEAWGIDDAHAAAAGAHWIAEHAALARAAGKPLLLGEFALANDGAFTLEARRAMYRGWFGCARAVGAAAGPWMFANDARPDGWDRYTFYSKDGSRPGDAVNRYADLVAGAVGP